MSGVSNPADLTEVLLDVEDNHLHLAIIQALAADTHDDVEIVDGNVDAVRAITDALPTLTETGGDLTTDGTEQNVYINNAPAGVFVPKWFIIDFTNQTVTETIVIRYYHRLVAGGAWVVEDSETFVGVPVNAGISVRLKDNRYGVRITIEKTAGTNRAYVWTVFCEV